MVSERFKNNDCYSKQNTITDEKESLKNAVKKISHTAGNYNAKLIKYVVFIKPCFSFEQCPIFNMMGIGECCENQKKE
jgi:hypothetical protein